MNDELNPVEEQAFDALLSEAIGSAGPPDLSDDILSHLQRTPLVQADQRSVTSARRDRSARRQVAVLVSVVTALAATLLVAIWIQSAHDIDPAPAVAGAAAPADQLASPQTTPAVDAGPSGNPAPVGSPKPARGIPLDLALDDSIADEPPPITRESPPATPSLKPPPQAIALVSQQVDRQLRDYWNAIGIDPAGDASLDEVVARVSRALGVELSADALNDPDVLQTELTRPGTARAISDRWFQQITQRGSLRIQPEARNGLIADLVACFQAKKKFDQTLASWINGESPHTTAFYSAISSGPRHANDSGAMIRRLAALTMNVDLRCTQCHDSYIEGSGRQEDFWAFTAFVRRSVVRGRDGKVTIAATAAGGKPFFYGLPDGRQGVAEPRVATAWMQSGSDQPIQSVRQWSERLVGSAELARGVVSSLWKLVHGQPLRGRVVDPVSAPHNEQLDELEEKLVEDLMRSDFDVARTLALIISSPATRRAVPQSLLPENALVADDAEIRAAAGAVNAFAAAHPPYTQLPMDQRYQQAMRAIGASLLGDGTPIVAQLNDSPGVVGPSAPRVDNLAADFPVRTQSLPVQWLASIDDPTAQVEHLAYLAGMSKTPDSVLEAAEKMRAADNNPTALQRVWWMVRP